MITEAPVAETPCHASSKVAEALTRLRRTEDIAFSPSGRRVAIACFQTHRITTFDLERVPSAEKFRLVGGVEISSQALKLPHGVAFLDDDRVIVTSRAGDIALFVIPQGDPDVPVRQVEPAGRWTQGGTSLWNVAGSVRAYRLEPNVYELLVCNNAAHTVTQHILDLTHEAAIRTSAVLVRKYLDIPDGVNRSVDRRWLAVSNHTNRRVLIYDSWAAHSADADPVGILRRLAYPHGLCFTADGRYLFVADAGAPLIHLYAQDADGWDGVRDPIASLRVMPDALFLRGHYSPGDGGPKGLDIEHRSRTLVFTSEQKPLAFFDVDWLLELAARGHSRDELRALELQDELRVMRESCRLWGLSRSSSASLDYLYNSRSWRITAPLRWLDDRLRRK